MSTFKLLDPETLPALDGFPDIALTKDILPVLREAGAAACKLLDPEAHGVSREEVTIPGTFEDQPDIRALLYKPAQRIGAKNLEDMAGYIHIHGGGYILGSPEMADTQSVKLVAALGITILSVDYRLAPEHPAPAALNDCYSALRWMHQNAGELGIDSRRIAVGGESAGGGLAAALVLYANKSLDYPICFQLLTYPMLDDRTGSESRPADPLTGEFVWTPERNQFGWACYLGDAAPQAPTVPARSEKLDRLPPTWIGTGGLDLFRDENIQYAQRLFAAGVATELIIYPSVCHGFQWATKAAVSKRYFRDYAEALSRGLSLTI